MSTDFAAEARPGATSTGHTSMSRLIVATSIGNALEFYDLIAYGYFATTLSKLFFPAHNATVHN